jgi:hypothetical protein
MGVYRFRSNPSSPEGIPVNPIHNRSRQQIPQAREPQRIAVSWDVPKPNKLT